jgi:hypothetical protein
MTQETLKWRLGEWLEKGCIQMSSSRLREFRRHANLRVLIVAGEKDGCLPSIAEAERLASLLPNTLLHVVDGAGHASTCGSRVDLTALFRSCFKELCTKSGIFMHRGVTTDSRISMKETAATGEGPYFGMEPRYDNQTVGLNPLKYWSNKFFRRNPLKKVSGPQ